MGTIRLINNKTMKTLILTIVASLLLSFGLFAQVHPYPLLKVDTLTFNSDYNTYAIFQWYSQDCLQDQNINSPTITSVVGLFKRLHTLDSTYVSPVVVFRFTLDEGDSIQNPFTGDYYSYDYIENTLYDNNATRAAQDTLALWQLIDWRKRLLK